MEKDKSLTNNAMFYGLIFGIVLVVYSFISQKAALSGGGMSKQIMLFGISLIVYVTAIVIATVHFRKNKLDNLMTYGQSFGFGVLVSVFASFIVAVYIYVYTQWINPEYLQDVFDMGKQTVLDMYDRMNVPDDAVEMAMEKIEAQGAGTPSKAAITQIWSGLLMGAIVSLITSIFTQRKNKDPFADVQDEALDS